MKIEKFLQTDLLAVKEAYPKLEYHEKGGSKMLLGVLDICDVRGVHWETFRVKILIPKTYPRGVPELYELSRIIDRGGDFHVSDNGFCCVDMEHELLVRASREFSLNSFISEYVYPFFTNHLYKKFTGKYASGEYAHDFEGVEMFYKEELNLGNPKIAIHVIKALLSNSLPSRNDDCICGLDAKFKNCHESQLKFLRSTGVQRLKMDLEGFKKLL